MPIPTPETKASDIASARQGEAGMMYSFGSVTCIASRGFEVLGDGLLGNGQSGSREEGRPRRPASIRNLPTGTGGGLLDQRGVKAPSDPAYRDGLGPEAEEAIGGVFRHSSCTANAYVWMSVRVEISPQPFFIFASFFLTKTGFLRAQSRRS